MTVDQLKLNQFQRGVDFPKPVEVHAQQKPTSGLSIHGLAKTDETGRLCHLNLAGQGLEGDIRHGGNVNSYYDEPHDATVRFDFVLANPPFNVKAVDKERLKDSVGPGRRFPFGLPRSDNANFLWIQLFHSALNAKGRAGFAMATPPPTPAPPSRKSGRNSSKASPLKRRPRRASENAFAPFASHRKGEDSYN
jgi:hypothetical protein